MKTTHTYCYGLDEKLHSCSMMLMEISKSFEKMASSTNTLVGKCKDIGIDAKDIVSSFNRLREENNDSLKTVLGALRDVSDVNKNFIAIIGSRLPGNQCQNISDGLLDPKVTDEGFVKELNIAVMKKSHNEIMQHLSDIAKALKQSIDSYERKLMKLDYRIKSPSVSGAEKNLSIKKSVEVKASIAVLKTRLDIIVERFFRVRKKMADYIVERTDEIIRFSGGTPAFRKCFLQYNIQELIDNNDKAMRIASKLTKKRTVV